MALRERGAIINIVASLLIFVDLGEIESPPRQCECRVLPLNYRP